MRTLTSQNAVLLLQAVGSPIRVPTARWLLSDVFDVLDGPVNQILRELQAQQLIVVDIGGWITVQPQIAEATCS